MMFGLGFPAGPSRTPAVLCSMYRSAALVIPNSAVTAVPLDAIWINIGNAADVVNGRMIAPISGIYRINAQLAFLGAAVNYPRALVNFTGFQNEVSVLAGGVGTPQGSILVSVAAGQIFSMIAFQNSGGPLGLNVGQANVYASIQSMF